MREKDILA